MYVLIDVVPAIYSQYTIMKFSASVMKCLFMISITFVSDKIRPISLHRHSERDMRDTEMIERWLLLLPNNFAFLEFILVCF